MKNLLIWLLMKFADLGLWLYAKNYNLIYALMGKKEEYRHVCTKFKDLGVVTMNGRLLHAQKCVECGRVVTCAGTYTSPEQVTKLRGLAEFICQYEHPKARKALLKHIDKMIDLAADALK